MIYRDTSADKDPHQREYKSAISRRERKKPGGGCQPGREVMVRIGMRLDIGFQLVHDLVFLDEAHEL